MELLNDERGVDCYEKPRRPASYLSDFRHDAMETTFSNRRSADTMCTLMKKMHSFESTKNPTRNVELRLVRVQSEHNVSR